MIPVIFARQAQSAVDRPRINVIAVAVLGVCVAIAWAAWQATGSLVIPVALALVGLALTQAPKVAQQWERAVVLRLGRFVGLRGPGLFFVVPFVVRAVPW